MKFIVSIVLMMYMVGISVVHGYPAEPLITFAAAPVTAKTPFAARRPIDPNHVPESACKNMLPIHGNNQPSNEDPPYEIRVSTNKVAPGDKVTVTIIGKNKEVYKGLYIQGRINDVPEGQFVDPNEPLIRVSNCPPGEKNAASYISGTKAVNKLEFDWIAPNSPGSEVIFRATIVKTFAEFWVGITSDKVVIQV